MLTSFTLKLLFFVCGVLLGIYLPLVGLYLLHFIRKTPFGFRLVWTASLRVISVLLGLVVLSIAVGMLVDFIGQSEYRLKYSAWLGWGVIFAFFAGTILFFVGVWKAWRVRAAQR